MVAAVDKRLGLAATWPTLPLVYTFVDIKSLALLSS